MKIQSLSVALFCFERLHSVVRSSQIAVGQSAPPPVAHRNPLAQKPGPAVCVRERTLQVQKKTDDSGEYTFALAHLNLWKGAGPLHCDCCDDINLAFGGGGVRLFPIAIPVQPRCLNCKRK